MPDFGDVLASAAKGAAGGAVLGPIGAIGGAVLALAADSGVTRWLFGDGAQETVQAVQQAATAITGTPDAAAQEAVLARDPEAAAKLRVALAQIAATREAAARQADLDTLRATFADVAGARQQTVALAQAGSGVAWAPVVVSATVLVTFGVVMFVSLVKPLPSGSETILNMLLGTLAAMSTAVVSYWVGSSAGSARKEELLANSVPVHVAAVAAQRGGASTISSRVS